MRRAISRWACTVIFAALMGATIVSCVRPTKLTLSTVTPSIPVSHPDSSIAKKQRLELIRNGFTLVRATKLGLSGGAIELNWQPGTDWSGLRTWSLEREAASGVCWIPQWHVLIPRFALYRLPLWIPLLAFAYPTFVVWRSHLRRRAANLCPNCDYSLTGLPAGSACPECGRGKAIPS